MRIALIRPNMGDYRSGDAMPPLVMGILAARASGHEIFTTIGSGRYRRTWMPISLP